MGGINAIVGIAHVIGNNTSDLFSISDPSCKYVLHQLMKEVKFDVEKVINNLLWRVSVD